MTQYLLAAEADKIQDFVFRSSRLREVVGGSQLLSRFCEEVPTLLNSPRDGMDIVINSGGSFRILFDDENQARLFGEQLAEVYRRAMDSTLTVADPVAVNANYGKASKEAEKELRKAKRWRERWQSQEHMPYIAFCASCGIGLAVGYKSYHGSDEKQYLCTSCLNKNAERGSSRQANEAGSFLENFYKLVLGGRKDLANFGWPGKEKYRGRSELDPTDDIADYDHRRYVAYLLADGNGMGKIFDECKKQKQMRKLSDQLTFIIFQALAGPTKEIMNNNKLEDRPCFIPVLPLILGGDDLFALIPAPWALDFAQSFCRVYEQRMAELIKDLGLNVPKPTISATVVVCKGKHPYKLAHEIGETRLKEAKQIGKRAILEDDKHYSTINFEVVLGGRLVSDCPSGAMRPTLRPYWVTDEEISDRGLSIQRLIDQRYNLRAIPNKRLSEIQRLFDPNNMPKKCDDIDWKDKLERLMRRIKQRNEDQGKIIEDALKSLGGNEERFWMRIDRDEYSWCGQGFPDLLEAWDFALELEKERKVYQGDR
jgi:hypothetical protein